MNNKQDNKIYPASSKTISLLERQIRTRPLPYLDSPALESVRKMTESSKLAALATTAYLDSPALESIRKMTESSKLAALAITAYLDSPALESIRKMTESSKLAALATTAYLDSPALESVRKMTESSKLAALATTAYLDSPALESVSLVGYASRTFLGFDPTGNFENGTRCVPYMLFGFRRCNMMERIFFGATLILTTDSGP
jgi:hypothetical protein